jgi:uncharacterized protein (TIGR01777 family)
MHVVLAGSSGFLGSHLLPALIERGHSVTPLVRRPARRRESSWDPYAGHVDLQVIGDADVVINLAGSPTAGNPHSRKWSKQLLHSRVTTTRVLAQAIAASDKPPAFLAGNGISYYGDHGSRRIDEDTHSSGNALLTRVTRVWQEAAQPARDAGARVCILRTAPVMDKSNPPLKMMIPLFKAGLGTQMGHGRQYFPMISLRDWVDAVCFLAEEQVEGPVNLCCEVTPTNAEFSQSLGVHVRRPVVLRAPALAIRMGAGPMAPEVLGSMNTRPTALLDAGYTFHDPHVGNVLESAFGE